MESLHRCAGETGVSISELVTLALTDYLSQAKTIGPCPYCKKADQLRELEWNHEHADGSEYAGPAVICDRCDAVAPLPAWLSLGSIQPQHVKHG